jgi:hypothetical protein
MHSQLRRIESHWRRTELQLAKYQKGGVDRSYVLKAADEIKLELEDHMLNLQVTLVHMREQMMSVFMLSAQQVTVLQVPNICSMLMLFDRH